MKLHGSADSEGPVLATFELVSLLGAQKVIPTVKHLFSTGRHKAVLILGYSCSDLFDIIPAIRAIERDKRKEVFLVEHSDKDSVEDIGEPGKGNPFEGFKGLRIRCNTDDFVSNLRRRLGDTVVVNQVASVKTETWRHFVQSWKAGLTMAQANYVVGRLCLKAPDYGVAVQRLEKSIQLAEVQGDSELLAVCLLSMADAYLGQGDLGKCLAILQKGRQLAREIPVPAGLAGGMLFSACARRTGEVFELLKSYKYAIECFEKGLALEERCAFDITETLFCRAGLANAYIHISRPAEAKTYCEKLPDSYPLIRPRRLELTAGIKRAEGSPEAAMDIYERAIHSHRLVGDNIGEAKCLFWLADLAEDLGRNERARQAFARCLDIASAAGAKLLESRTCTRLGYIAFENGNYERSVGFHQRSLRAEQEFEFRLDEGLSYMNIGSALANWGATEKLWNSCPKQKISCVRTLRLACYRNVSEIYPSPCRKCKG